MDRDFKTELAGKTLCRNGRKAIKIEQAVQIPETSWICVQGKNEGGYCPVQVLTLQAVDEMLQGREYYGWWEKTRTIFTLEKPQESPFL